MPNGIEALLGNQSTGGAGALVEEKREDRTSGGLVEDITNGAPGQVGAEITDGEPIARVRSQLSQVSVPTKDSFDPKLAPAPNEQDWKLVPNWFLRKLKESGLSGFSWLGILSIVGILMGALMLRTPGILQGLLISDRRR